MARLRGRFIYSVNGCCYETMKDLKVNHSLEDGEVIKVYELIKELKVSLTMNVTPIERKRAER